MKKRTILHTYPPMKMEHKERSETSAYKIQTPGNYPEESMQHKLVVSPSGQNPAVSFLLFLRF
jgi:hypothetical protein